MRDDVTYMLSIGSIHSQTTNMDSSFIVQKRWHVPSKICFNLSRACLCINVRFVVVVAVFAFRILRRVQFVLISPVILRSCHG